jgi:hypothetical protein
VVVEGAVNAHGVSRAGRNDLLAAATMMPAEKVIGEVVACPRNQASL